ncbi:ATP-binding cassette sub-family G member 3-like isoform X3 [Peromyscus maniculatus bairdii]|uniref:ATP-binding cassette sub-family G member 3-like isoform X3 n=1 Tax=Peromyscus maniculatus bairdii TaxID=230844 RepID=UPI003FD0E1CB
MLISHPPALVWARPSALCRLPSSLEARPELGSPNPRALQGPSLNPASPTPPDPTRCCPGRLLPVLSLGAAQVSAPEGGLQRWPRSRGSRTLRGRSQSLREKLQLSSRSVHKQTGPLHLTLFVYMVGYIDRFSYVEPFLHRWKEEPLEMSSNNDPVAIPMIERNPSDLPGMDSSDPDTLTGEAVLSFHNISYRETVQSGFPFRKKTEEKERLSNVNGIMRPGLNAIMGPEDGSRSWLLDVLAARKDPRGLSGDILINGKPRPANFKCTSGYVPQPRSKELRKRTSIAMELVAEHPILFLDDPTTGLDLRTTIDVISVLRRISMRGQTVIFSINQAQYTIFRFFDSLTLVASGKVMYHGPAQEALEYFKSAGYKYDSHNNPADFFLDIINGGFSAILDTEEEGHDADKYTELSERRHQVTEKLDNMYAQSSLYREMRTELDLLLGEQRAGRSSALERIMCVTPFWHQLWWIICRSFKNYCGFSQVTVIQAFIIAILSVSVGTIFRILRNDCNEVHIRAGLLFVVTIFQTLTSVSAGELFVNDEDRFLHEHTSGYYRVLPYFLGKLLAELVPRRLLPSTIVTVTVFSIAGVNTDVKSLFTMYFTIMMLAYSASSLSLSLRARQNAVAVQTLSVTIYFLFMLIFSGLSIYSESLVPGLSWIQYFNIPHYGFTALQHNEFLGQNFCTEHNIAEVSRCQNYVICTGEEFLMIQGFDRSSWGFWKNHVVLACITIIFLSINYVQLLALNKKRHF